MSGSRKDPGLSVQPWQLQGMPRDELFHKLEAQAQLKDFIHESKNRKYNEKRAQTFIAEPSRIHACT